MTTALAIQCRRRQDATQGMTLVELLVTIMIIGIMASAILFSMSLAQEAARRSRTQALIATLHSMLIEQWDSYLTKRNSRSYSAEILETSRREAAKFRLKGIRQYQKMDFPDQWHDIAELYNFSDPLTSDTISSMQVLYGSTLTAITNAIAANSSIAAADRTKVLNQNEGAECLYMIITALRGTGNKWQKFSDSMIGDTDGDSAQEFLDGWGRPIEFIRWPAGFVSDMQTGVIGAVSDTQPAAILDHDPFDPYRTEAAYRIVPLIISAGPDGSFDVAQISIDSTNNTDLANRWNPYYRKQDSASVYRRAGESYFDQNKNGIAEWADNIHNHLVHTR